MKQSSFITAIIVLIVGNISCSKEIEFNDKLLDPVLVVNSICTLNDTLMVDVSSTKTIPGFESSFRFIPDATVKLYVDGVESEQLFFDSTLISQNNCARYHSNTIVTTGKKYRVEVSHKDFNKVATAEMQMSNLVPILGFETEDVVKKGSNAEDSKLTKVTVRFSDPADEKNYYRLGVTVRIGKDQSFVNEVGDSVIMVQVMDNISYGEIESDDPVLATNSNADDIFSESSSFGYALFTDELFNGKTYDLDFYLSSWISEQLSCLNTLDREFYSIDIELQSLTKDTYYYIKSSGLSGFGDGLFTEPVQVFNNIENGLGIFGGCSSSVSRTEKGTYPIDNVRYYYGYSSF